jgi:hypothetical protein
MNPNDDCPPQDPTQPSSSHTVSVVSINFYSKIVQVDSERNLTNQSIEADKQISLQNLRSDIRKGNSVPMDTEITSPESIPVSADSMPEKSHPPKHMQASPAPDRQNSRTSGHGSQFPINNVISKTNDGTANLEPPTDHNDAFKMIPVNEIPKEQSEPEYFNFDPSRSLRKSLL